MQDAPLESLHLCIDRVLPKEMQDDAQLAAISENPANFATPAENNMPPREKSIALLKKKLWQPGRTLPAPG